MKFKNIVIVGLILFGLLLAGCSSETVEPLVDDTDATDADGQTGTFIEGSIPDDQDADSSEDADIIITGTNIDPNSLVIQNNERTTLEIYNQGPTQVRFEIPLYGSEVNVEIPADGKEIVVLEPRAKGSVSIELNGAQVGTVVIE